MILLLIPFKQSEKNDMYHSYRIIQRKHVTHGSKRDNDNDITSHRVSVVGTTEFMMYQSRFRIILFSLMYPVGFQSFSLNSLSINTMLIPNGYDNIKHQVILFVKGCCSVFISLQFNTKFPNYHCIFLIYFLD